MPIQAIDSDRLDACLEKFLPGTFPDGNHEPPSDWGNQQHRRSL